MMKSTRISAMILLTATVMGLPATTKAQQKEFYNFKMNETPAAIPNYGSVSVYSVADDKVYTLRNSVMADLGDPITWMAFNPTGFNFVIVGKGKKHGEARVIITNDFNNARYKHNVKRHGSPTSAIFTPDARSLVIASDRGTNIFETRKYQQVDTFPSDIPATEMAMSGNGYFLAMTDGSKVAVYNFADKRLRKEWTFEVPVTQVAFSPDDSEFAVLTSDGLMSIYNTRDFIIKKNIDGLGEGIDFDYNPDGKYVAVATSPSQIAIVNTLDDSDREYIDVAEGGMTDVKFLVDAQNATLLAYNAVKSVNVKRLTTLLPHYARLISDQADEMMNEWLKMMPGETMEQYRARVNDESRARQRRMFEDEISTGLAGDLVSMSKISLGKYDRGNQVLAVEFDNMPTILLPVPENSVSAFADVDNLTVEDAKYGIMPNDNFELIYAKFHNRANGETYIYDNLDRVQLAFMDNDDNVVSIEVLQQQQMEEMKLQQLREKVVAEAKSRNVISDHTSIAVDSRVVPDYDADGKKILNYIVRFSYEVEPDYSIHEDFGPGKYKVDESGAASSMLSIIKQAFEGDLAQYVAAGKKLRVNISGAADGTPIRRIIPYDGCYGDFEEEPVVKDGQMTAISVTQKSGITQNEQLAFLRGYGVKDFLQRNVNNLDKMNADYRYNIAVSEDKGSEFRRIVAELTFIDVF